MTNAISKKKITVQKTTKYQRPNFKKMVLASLGAFLAGSVLGIFNNLYLHPVVMGSFGASIFLVMAVPDNPFSQPRHVIGGHLLASLIGLFFLHIIGEIWWSMAFALALSVLMMLVLKVPHPPAASNPIAIFLVSPDWLFLLAPTFLGSAIVVFTALLFNNLFRRGVYPQYW